MDKAEMPEKLRENLERSRLAQENDWDAVQGFDRIDVYRDGRYLKIEREDEYVEYNAESGHGKFKNSIEYWCQNGCTLHEAVSRFYGNSSRNRAKAWELEFLADEDGRLEDGLEVEMERVAALLDNVSP